MYNQYKTLKLNNCDDIPELPEDLEYLKLTNCKFLLQPVNPPIILKNLKELDIVGFVDSMIPNCNFQLLENLQILRISDSVVDNFSMNLPISLKQLKITNFSYNNVTINNLPDTLEHLHLTKCRIVDIKFPKYLKTFSCTDCWWLMKELPELTELTDIYLNNIYTDMKHLVLPKNLLTLECYRSNFKIIELSDKLTELFLWGCPTLKLLTVKNKFPNSLKNLTLVRCEFLKELPEFTCNNINIKIDKCNLLFLNWNSVNNLVDKKPYIVNIENNYERYRKNMCKIFWYKIRHDLENIMYIKYGHYLVC